MAARRSNSHWSSTARLLLRPRQVGRLCSVNDAGSGPICSAKGCRALAVWSLRWNNPRLHPAERRKTWLACVEHRTSLGEFLGVRGFLREVAAIDRSPTLDT